MNIFLISIDSLRKDYLGVYSNNKVITPNIDLLSNNSIICDNCFSTGNSTYSIISLLSSTYPLDYDGYRIYSNKRPSCIELLRNKGFFTVGINTNLYLIKQFGFNKGFLEYIDLVYPTKFQKFESTKLKKIGKIILYTFNLYSKYKKRSNGKHVLQKAKKILKNKKENIFMWLHFMDVHRPYIPHKKYLRKLGMPLNDYEISLLNEKCNKKKLTENEKRKLRLIYQTQVMYIDELIGNFLNLLKKQNLFEESIIIITADHGEELGEYGNFGHFNKFIEEQINVPLIIKLPNQTNKIRIKKNVSLIDVFPTIFDIIKIKKFSGLKGISIFDAVTNRPLFCEIAHDETQEINKNKIIISTIINDLKLIYNTNLNEKKLFSLNKKININLKNKKHKDILNITKKRLASILKQDFLNISYFEEEMKNRLEFLGYTV